MNVSSDGRRLSSSKANGRVRITLEDPSGTTRVLLDVNAGSQYGLGTPQWSPDESFALTSDGAARLLVTTLGPTPQTRALATELGGAFAITSQEF